MIPQDRTAPMTPYLHKRLRSFDEARRERITTSVSEKMEAIRTHIEAAEMVCNQLSDELSDEAHERVCELYDFLGRDLIPDWLVPAETAVKEYLESEEERDAPVGRMR